jgi:hypothetical protein
VNARQLAMPLPEPAAPPALEAGEPSAARAAAAVLPGVCLVNPVGRHVPVDLSALRLSASAPFCAWCGHEAAE